MINLPSGIDWSTKQGDWLGVSAIMSDNAGNQILSENSLNLFNK